MSIIEAANSTPRIQGDEEGYKSWDQTAAKLSKNSRFPPLYTHKGAESVSKQQMLSMKLSKLAPFPLNTSDYATAWRGGTTSMRTDVVRWTLGSLPSWTMELKFASDTTISMCWVWVWKRKDRYDSFLPLTNPLKLVILKKNLLFLKA